MNKQELVSLIREENKSRLKRQIKSASEAYDFLESLSKADTVDGTHINYIYNGVLCACVYKDLMDGVLEFKPISMDGDLGMGAGECIRLIF